MQSACCSYYARMQPAYAGVCRLLQAACILQKSCMRGACVSSSFHFASAFVAVIFSQLMASSSASWSLNKPPSRFVSGHESTICSMVCCSPQSQSPFMHFSMTWALTCAETVQQCPGVARQVEARLLCCEPGITYHITYDEHFIMVMESIAR